MVALASASNHRLDTVVIIQLTVSAGTELLRQPFVVVRQLGADAILGCTFIDAHVNAIFVRKRFVELNNGDVELNKLLNGDRIAIQRRRARPTRAESSREPHEVGEYRRNDLIAVKVARSITLHPHTEHNVSVTCPSGGNCLLETRPELYDRKRITLSNGVVDIRSNVPFIARVANFSSVPIVLQRNEGLGVSTP